MKYSFTIGISVAFVYIQKYTPTIRNSLRVPWVDESSSTGSFLIIEKGFEMKPTGIDVLKEKVCGKKIISVALSQWSGEGKVPSKTPNYVSIKLDDGTTLEIGSVFLHEEKKIADSHTNP